MPVKRLQGPARSQAGAMLIESIVAMAVFAIGVLALIALQAVATREVTNAKFRSDASYIADRIVGDLSSVDLRTATLAARMNVFEGDYTAAAVPAFTGSPEPAADAARARSWQSTLAGSLPNGRVSIIVDESANPPPVTIAVSWESPTGTAVAPSPCWRAGDTQPRACFVQVATIADDS